MQLANFNLYNALTPARSARQSTSGPLSGLFASDSNQNLFNIGSNVVNLVQGFLATGQNSPYTPALNNQTTINAAKAREVLPYLEICRLSYQKNVAPAGWERLNIANLDGLPLHDPDSGFDVDIFKNLTSNEITVSFRGSEQIIPFYNDWMDDSRQVQGQLTPQAKQAMQLAQAAANTFGDNLTFTGHSLGGGLAQIAGTLVGRKAYGFNSLGTNSTIQNIIGADKITRNQHLIEHINMKGEVSTDLDNQQDADALGGKLFGNVYYADNASYKPLALLDLPFTRHLLTPLKEALQSTLGQPDLTDDTVDTLIALVTE